MRYLTTIALLLVVAAGCNKSKKLDPVQLEARQAVKNLGARIQGQNSVTVKFMRKDIKDSDLAALTALNNVSYLDLTDTEVGDEAMTYLPRIQGLQVLILSGTNVTDAGMVHVVQISGLVQLTCNEQIGDDGVAAMVNAPNLNYLNLENSRVTDDGLAHLASMQSLKRLNLDGTEITDKGLVHLQALSALHTLQLNATKITDKGLPLLENLSNLSALAIAGTGATPVGVAKLQNALPDTGVDSGETVGSPMGMGGPGGGALSGGAGGGGGGGRGGGGGGRSFNPEAIVDRVMEGNDKDGDGILSAEEIEGISEQFRSRIVAADADEDGTISKDELLKYYTDRVAQRGSGGEGGGRPGGSGGGRPGGGDSGQPGGGDEGSPAEEPAEDSAQENQGGVFGSLLRAVGNGTQKAIANSGATAPVDDDGQ
jgi:hypothetical protein